MVQTRYKTREKAFKQLNRLAGCWLDKNGSETTFEWMPGGNFMVQKLGENGASGLEMIGYDSSSGLLKSSFYASDESMLDNGGLPINYIYNIEGDDLEVTLDVPDRHGSFIGKLSQDDTVLTGRWDWVQNGEKMGYDTTLTKQSKKRALQHDVEDIVKLAPKQHKVIFENDQVRILKVTVKPGEAVPLHTNPENINYILRPGTLRLTGVDGDVTELVLTEGQVIPAPVGTHAVENIGKTEVQTIGVELKA